MRTPHRPRAVAMTAGCVLSTAMALVTACSSTHAVPGDTPDTATVEERELAILRQRPDIGSAVARHEKLLAALRGALSARLHWGPWDGGADMRENSLPTSCSPEFFAIDGQRVTLPLWYAASTDLTSPQWIVARDLVADIAAGHGFRRGRVASDEPGNYTISFTDDDGAHLTFGAFRNATLTLITGCHLGNQHTPLAR
ncbi:LppA family lipoprotein [Amycolatopsis azurea]|uniref:LppA family lipoprotein n=1 Tax=Amycolatopsis azurea TaxID=36819 RepID=UPI0038251040